MNDYPAEMLIHTLQRPLNAIISVPGSKSITNRALILSAISGRGAVLTGALQSEDTEVMIESLVRLGFQIATDWDHHTIRVADNLSGRVIPATQANLYVENSGTSMRFLTALCAVGEGRYRIDGVPRMGERPMQDLLDALTQLGANARSEANNGCPPIIIESLGLHGGRINMKADTSSQFLSAIMMAASRAADEVVIDIEGATVSEPYIEMTLCMMHSWGLSVSRDGNRIAVSPGSGPATQLAYEIEPDASAASYFYAAAAIAEGRVTVRNAQPGMQGDWAFPQYLIIMGCDVEYSDSGTTVGSDDLCGGDFDMNDISDTVPTMAAVACFANSPTTIRNVAHIRRKECDRIAATCTELRKLGVEVEEHSDGMTITPRPMTGCALETYNDHRIAMSLALIGLKVPGVVIRNPGCVAKTYPGFWNDFEKLYVKAS